MGQVSMWHRTGKEVRTFAKFSLPAPEWHRDAACGPEHIPLMSPPATDERESVAEEAARIVAAKRICRECPVISQCSEDAYRNEHQEGIWGGECEYERPYTTKAALYRVRDEDSREARVMRAVLSRDALASITDAIKGAA